MLATAYPGGLTALIVFACGVALSSVAVLLIIAGTMARILLSEKVVQRRLFHYATRCSSVGMTAIAIAMLWTYTCEARHGTTGPLLIERAIADWECLVASCALWLLAVALARFQNRTIKRKSEPNQSSLPTPVCGHIFQATSDSRRGRPEAFSKEEASPMNTTEEKALLGAQEDLVNRVIEIQADVQATRELVILLANKLLAFGEPHDAASVWTEFFEKAKAELAQQSKEKILRKMM